MQGCLPTYVEELEKIQWDVQIVDVSLSSLWLFHGKFALDRVAQPQALAELDTVAGL